MICSYRFYHSTYYSNDESITNLGIVDFDGSGENFHITNFNNIDILLRFQGKSRVFNISKAIAIYRLVGDFNHGGPYCTTWYEFLFRDENGLLYGNIPNPSFGKTPSPYYYRGYKVYWEGRLYYDVPLTYRCWCCDRGVPLETVSFSYFCLMDFDKIKRVLGG